MEDEVESDERKQAAADALFDYSLFIMTAVGEGVRPSHLRLHLMKEIAGMPTTLREENPQAAAPAASIDKASSSAGDGTSNMLF